MTLDPVRRSYSESEPSSRWSRMDAAARSRWVHAAGWLVPVGGVLGVLASMAPGGGVPFVAGLVGGALLGGVAAGVVAAAAAGVGDGAGFLLHRPGRLQRRPPEFSRARALAMQGDYAAAVEAYEAHIAEDPAAPDAYLALARLLSTDAKDPEAAARVLRRARREAELTEALEILVGRRLVELYRHDLGDPRRAAPELARLAETFAHTPEGERAARELEEVKRAMTEDDPG